MQYYARLNFKLLERERERAGKVGEGGPGPLTTPWVESDKESEDIAGLRYLHCTEKGVGGVFGK